MTQAGAGAAPVCQPPDPRPQPPRVAVPAGAWDCHAHVFGPPERYPYRPDRRYTPAAAGLAEYRHALATLGIAHAVIVQPEIYPDNAVTFDALQESGGAWRGIARLGPEASEAEIALLDKAGFRGVRFNGRAGLAGLGDLPALAIRIAPFGWHVQLHLFARDLSEIAPMLERLPVPVVLDHFARIDAEAGPERDGLRALLDLLASRRCWVKLSAPYRLTASGAPYPAVTALAQALVAAAPEQLLWGSDWPHSSYDGPVPNDGELLDLLALWAPDPAARDAILRTNPARLYGFPDAVETGSAPSRRTIQ